MTKIIPLAEVTDAVRGGVISIGNFDGVHRGHAALIGKAREMANRIAGPVVAVVLDPHPAAILRPDRVPPKLTWIERRAELLSHLDTDFLIVVPTNQQFLNLSAADFFSSLIKRTLAAKGMVEGPNFFFGRGREGNIETLQALCDQSEIELAVADSSIDSDAMISSTRIRQQLEAGKIESAVHMLGHPHQIRGRVVRGDGRGAKIGFPTANLDEIDVLVPAVGVYGGYAIHDGQRYQAAIHIGPNPTFNNRSERKVEVHLMDYTGDLYDQTLLVDFVSRVRDIARFDSAEALVAQLQMDIASVRSSLGKPENDHIENAKSTNKTNFK
ncbi:bifunctional riboflavin kinase/FAD synthetase [Novipirellula caenicola]|uniref:Riboflavin biosynthesis protein n=1 Tax=Novipirellula caenicola TaxID=1536901 RepID=A0ABP9VMS3_9BACT